MIVTSMEYKNPNIKGHPRRFLNNSILLKTYSGIGNGPQICLDFLKTIMNSLEILPSIYALFDYIDLQYRIYTLKSFLICRISLSTKLKKSV